MQEAHYTPGREVSACGALSACGGAFGEVGLFIDVLFLGRFCLRPIAQVVEHWSPKPKVVGSSPAGPGFFNWL